MGYGGKWRERERARELRAQAWTLHEIAHELRVSKSSLSVWLRDVEFTPKPRNRGHAGHRPHPMRVRKEAQIEQCRLEAEAFAASLSFRDRTMFCLGLYAGEGTKTKASVGLANTNPTYLRLFVKWMREMFAIDESRLRCVVYLHEGLDIDAASRFWSDMLDIPLSQFTKPYRAAADPTRRSAKHVNGCATVRYACSLTLRRLLALIEAVSCEFADPG